jgi:predicted AlkP superfamily pyrophosphatase or phosphodiesterase
MRVALIAVVLLFTLGSAGAPVRAQAVRPKLVVFIVVDQLRGDYLEEYDDLLKHGLKRLKSGGAWFRNGAYPFHATITCAGHATIGTGTLPYKHGMINNAWYDRATERVVNCTTDAEALEVSYGTSVGAGDSAKRMMVPALAEIMRGTLKSRVAAMSIKARSAIALAGHEGDVVTWFGDRGSWETSSAYSKTPAPWLVAFLKGNPVDKDTDKVWERSLPADKYKGVDEGPAERAVAGWTTSFPHPLGNARDSAALARWLQSPYADDYLGRMAEAAVDEMHLGTEDRTDFLGVSFSMMDAVGHGFGPKSHEVQDVLVRLDATIGRLLDHLDKKVGAANYVVALSSDHGVADLPEQVPGAGRQSMAGVRQAIESVLKPAFGGEGPFIAAVSGGEVYFKPGVYERLKGAPATLKAVIAAVSAMSGVSRVVTSDEVSTAAARESKDRYIRAVALSYFPDRSGDLFVIPKENWLFVSTGTTHGSLYEYDQRVPVLLYGAGIRSGSRREAATPADLAVTIASLVGVTLPSPDGRVLTEALAKPKR